MKLSRIGRISMALVVSVAMGLGMTACGGGTVGFMWVLGTQYNQIAGFKIDNFTGNLTTMPHQPFTSGGGDPVSLAVKPGGRYLYVVNKGGTNTTTTGTGTPCTAAGGVAEFSIGGDGVLTYQQCFSTQGSLPVWATTSSDGAFLYVLDQRAPNTDCDATTPVNCHGDITVFAIDDNTGRLTLVPNQQVKNPDGSGTQLTYFPVGNTPTMMKVAGTGCLFTLDAGDQTVFPYSVGGSGQLNLPANTTISIGPSRKLTSINAGGSYVYLTDAAGTADSPGGFILPYTVGTGCALNTVTGGQISNLPLTSNPVNTLINAKNTYLYVLNQSTSNSNAPAYSSISAFKIDQTTGLLTQVPDQSNPYQSGTGPVCIVQDPSGQYVYTSNSVDGTVTGYSLYDPDGRLQALTRGSTFTATGQATCLTVSGNVN
jgi:6-phosphogluconolactonase (cycloisomerase 2 family)